MSEARKILNLEGQFSMPQFEKARRIFSALTGNRLGLDKKGLLESRLRKRMIETSLSIDEYLVEVQNNQAELSLFVSALTTHKTDWFREPVHFNFLKKVVMEEPAFLTSERFLQIWSAACSTGEECYSLAMTLSEMGLQKFRILGTDISQQCVEKASSGIFAKATVDKQVPPYLKQKYFLRSVGSNNKDKYRIHPKLCHQMKFREFNLIDSSLGGRVEFDFIFLRNVLIYFDADSGFNIVKRLSAHLRKGGYFIIGLSETVKDLPLLGLTRVGNSVFKK